MVVVYGSGGPWRQRAQRPGTRLPRTEEGGEKGVLSNGSLSSKQGLHFGNSYRDMKIQMSMRDMAPRDLAPTAASYQECLSNLL